MITRRCSSLYRALDLLTTNGSARNKSHLPISTLHTRANDSARRQGHLPIRSSDKRSLSSVEQEDIAAPFEDVEERIPRLEAKFEQCECWVHDVTGSRQGIVQLNPALFGLPPRMDILIPVILRQLKYKLQDEPYGSEENNFINFDRFQDPLYQDKPYLKPWIKQGVAWSTSPLTKPTEFKYGSTSHMPIPHYQGDVPKKLREIGLRNLLSLKYRYNKLHVVDDLSTTERYIEPKEFRGILDESGFTSALMITGNHITPHFKSGSWGRKEPFPVLYPGTQRLWKTACNTPGCELREVEGLDVWSALLYDTLILDLSAISRLSDMIDTQEFSTPNINLRRAIQTLGASETTLGPAKPRHKVVRVVNLDNL